jgi:hypothetical protein
MTAGTAQRHEELRRRVPGCACLTLFPGRATACKSVPPCLVLLGQGDPRGAWKMRAFFRWRCASMRFWLMVSAER